MKRIPMILLKIVFTLFSIIGLCFSGWSLYHKRGTSAAAVSIIGGADGPTSIFLAGKIGGNSLFDGIALYIATFVIICITIFLYIKDGKKNRR